MKLRGRSSRKQVTSGRRHAQPADASRRQFTYYTGSRLEAGANDTPRARREPLPRSKAEALRFVGQRFGTIVAVVAAVILLISSIQVAMQPRLSFMNDSKVYRLHSNDLYEQRITQSLRSSWTNTNKITIDTERIAQDLKSAYPEIADASVVLPVIGQRPLVYLRLTRPSLVMVSSDGNTVVLDETGRVLAPASQVPHLDSFKLPTVTDQSGLQVKPGELAMSRGSVVFIEAVLSALKSAHFSYGRIVLPAASQEVDVYFENTAYYGKFNTHDEATVRQQVGAFVATARYLEGKGKTPHKYIDARLPGRTYYK